MEILLLLLSRFNQAAPASICFACSPHLTGKLTAVILIVPQTRFTVVRGNNQVFSRLPDHLKLQYMLTLNTVEC